MSVALRGNLEDFGIADVFQLIGQQRKTGMLEFAGAAGRIQLRIDRGAVVSAAPVGAWHDAALAEMLLRCGRITHELVEDLRAACEESASRLTRVAVDRGWLGEREVTEVEDLLTRETIFEVLQWSGGSFDFTAQAVVHERPFEALLGAEQILMDGLRMVDEWNSFAELVPSEDTVFRRVGTLDAFSQQASREGLRRLPAIERVFGLVDGRLAVRRIVDLSLLGTFEAVRALAELHRLEIIEPAGVVAAARARLRPRKPAGVPRLRAFTGTVLPLLILAAVALATPGSWTRSAPEPGLVIQRSPLAALRSGYETRRLRHALEVHRFRRGSWPTDLPELERERLLPAAALASAEGRPYYYRSNREEGALLLAPER